MRYKVLTKDAVIDPEVALLQGAYALDAAGVVAENTSDVEGLLSVAAMWMKFSEGIHNFAEKMAELEEKVELDKPGENKIGMGFCAPADEDDNEEDSDDRVEG